MSLQLEPGQKLTKFQRQYLADRGVDPDEFESRKADVDSEPDEADVSDEEDVPYEKWSKEELQIEARNRELDDSGTQKQLVKRLEDHDADNAPEVPPHTPA